MTVATIICAWCQKELGTKDVEVPAGMPAVTHGICDDCKAEAKGDAGLRPEEEGKPRWRSA